ncbi:MAG: peptide chain release factor N(5)-glutamine methyltransferase, partial [Rhizobiaceae bacterium]
DTFHREAQLLVMHAAGIDKAALISRAGDMCPPELEQDILELVQRRCSHEPVFRIIGRREFHGLELGLNSATLEPRDDTECLVELTLRRIRRHDQPMRFLDLGTGSGAVALALLMELPCANAVATDLSEPALEQALENASCHGLQDRFEGVQSDWFSAVSGEFDFMVSNPPYICSADIDGLKQEVRKHDPMSALNGGVDGLDAYRVILGSAAKHLKANGFLTVETGYGQTEDVVALATDLDWVLVDKAEDLTGTERALAFQTGGPNHTRQAGRI